MAFVVEDGTGLSTATSYLSVADAASFLADRGDTVWAAAETADQQAALIRATSAIDQMWFGLFLGTKYSETQALQWPRADAVDQDDFDLTGVPVYLERATAIAALIELSDSGALSPSLERGGAVKEESVAGAVKVVYQNWAPSTTQYLELNRAIAPLLKTTSGMLQVFRG